MAGKRAAFVNGGSIMGKIVRRVLDGYSSRDQDRRQGYARLLEFRVAWEPWHFRFAYGGDDLVRINALEVDPAPRGAMRRR
jgi:hypothetical protein